MARLLRDAQVNTIWEGPDNILCLDVRRAIERDGADAAVPRPAARGGERAGRAGRRDRAPGRQRADRPARAGDRRAGRRSTARPARRGCSRWPSSWSTSTPRALLVEQAGWEQGELGSDRKALVARLYVRAHLADPGPLRGIDLPPRSSSGSRILRRLVHGLALTTPCLGMTRPRDELLRRSLWHALDVRCEQPRCRVTDVPVDVVASASRRSDRVRQSP